MAKYSTEFSVPTRYADLGGLLATLAAHAAAAGIDTLHAHRLQMAVEELFANTIHHGFHGESAQPVTVSLTADPTGATLRYIDRAPPFDMTAVPALGHDAERIGGFGLNMIRAMAAAIRHSDRDGVNCTEMDFEF